MLFNSALAETSLSPGQRVQSRPWKRERCRDSERIGLRHSDIVVSIQITRYACASIRGSPSWTSLRAESIPVTWAVPSGDWIYGCVQNIRGKSERRTAFPRSLLHERGRPFLLRYDMSFRRVCSPRPRTRQPSRSLCVRRRELRGLPDRLPSARHRGDLRAASSITTRSCCSVESCRRRSRDTTRLLRRPGRACSSGCSRMLRAARLASLTNLLERLLSAPSSRALNHEGRRSYRCPIVLTDQLAAVRSMKDHIAGHGGFTS